MKAKKEDRKAAVAAAKAAAEEAGAKDAAGAKQLKNTIESEFEGVLRTTAADVASDLKPHE